MHQVFITKNGCLIVLPHVHALQDVLLQWNVRSIFFLSLNHLPHFLNKPYKSVMNVNRFYVTVSFAVRKQITEVISQIALFTINFAILTKCNSQSIAKGHYFLLLDKEQLYSQIKNLYLKEKTSMHR